MTTLVASWPSNICVKATPGVGSVNFRTMDLGGAFFNWSYCLLYVLSDTLGLRCMMFIFYFKKADLGTMALVAISFFSFSE